MIKNVVCKVLGAKNALRNASANNVDELTFLQLWHKLAFESIFEKKHKNYFHLLLQTCWSAECHHFFHSFHSLLTTEHMFLPSNPIQSSNIPFNPMNHPTKSNKIPFQMPSNPTKSHQNHQMAMGQNLVPLVNIQIAGKWMFIPLKMYLYKVVPPFDS